MRRPVPKEQIKALECKHAVYCEARDDSKDDLLFIKENIHTKDGQVIPNRFLVKNFQRDFWVTKPGHRKHKDKLEWDDASKMQKFTTTQAELTFNVARALGKTPKRQSLRRLARSPYLYGADITTPTIIKKQYKDRYPNAISDNTVAVIDIETDVVVGHKRPIYVGITYRNRAFLATTREFMGSIPTPEKKLHLKFQELLGEYIRDRGIELEVMVCRDAGAACYEAIQRAHQWQPDFLAAWNMDFDIPRIADTLQQYGYDLNDVFSDPCVPEQFRFFSYKQGPSQKVTASGKITPIHPADRWHVAECPASFFIIDSMCLYKRIRLAEQNEPSYSLDFQLQHHLGVRKLRFKEAEPYSKLEWHEFMQANYKIEYGIYNLFDCIGVELFDEKVKDLAKTVSVHAGISEYTIFNSQPKRLIDQYYYTCLEKGKVIACVSDQMTDELDDYVLGMTKWIITLPSYLTVDNGIKAINDHPAVRTMIYGHVADLDVAGAYPHGQIILNISKETTYRELCRIKGIPEETQRLAGINLTASHVNSLEIVQAVLNGPTLDKLLIQFQKDIEENRV